MTSGEHGTTAGAFEPRGRSKVALLVQPRPRRNASYRIYGDELGAPEVFVHVGVIADLCRAALDAMPDETIGTLLGRPCRDDYGTYVVVETALTAAGDEYEGTPGAVRISAQGRSSMQRRAAQRHPALEPVGWWHSHPHGPPRYSAVDCEEQRTYPREHHVGIVVAAQRLWDGAYDEAHPDALGVYVGPSASLLARRPRLTRDVAEPVAAHGAAFAQRSPERVARLPREEPADPGRPSWQQQPVVASGHDAEPPPPLTHATASPPAGGVSNLALIVASAFVTVLFLIVVSWLVFVRPGSGAEDPAGAGSTATRVACRPNADTRVELDGPAQGIARTGNPRVAEGDVQGSTLTVLCNSPGKTVLTIGDGADLRRVTVEVAAAAGTGGPR